MRRPLLALLCVLALPLRPALAEREHTVRAGQSLSRIAERYQVRVQDLAAANQLRVTSELQEGQVLRIPERGVHYVQSGETLASIARRRETTVEELRRVNRLRSDSLQLGQRLVLPGHDALEAREEAEERWGAPRHPGVASFVRVLNHERLRLRLLDERGRPRRGARRQLAHLFRYRLGNEQREPNQRLMQLLAQISDHFGGRLISVLSAYRPAGGNTQESSRHVAGAALDMRIQGVPLTILRDYLRTFPRTGVGFYPNGNFVHFDVRDRSAFWVDQSARGEDPEYDREAAQSIPAPAQ